MSDIWDKFLKPLSMQYAKPKAAEATPKEWRAAYEIVLKPYDAATLERAALLVLASREKGTFPLPAECNRACLDATDMLAVEKRRAEMIPVAKPGDKQGDWDRRSKRADELFAAHPSATVSLREEWWWLLWSWLQKHERAPDPHELRKIRDDGVAMYGRFKQDIQGNVFGKRLSDWRQKAKDRLQSLVKEVADA